MVLSVKIDASGRSMSIFSLSNDSAAGCPAVLVEHDVARTNTQKYSFQKPEQMKETPMAMETQ